MPFLDQRQNTETFHTLELNPTTRKLSTLWSGPQITFSSSHRRPGCRSLEEELQPAVLRICLSSGVFIIGPCFSVPTFFSTRQLPMTWKQIPQNMGPRCRATVPRQLLSGYHRQPYGAAV